MEGSENTDIVMHEPLLAEEEPMPTPPESPLLTELDSLMPGSSPARTPSPSPGIFSKEDPKLLGPGSWNEDRTSKGGGSKGSSKPNSRSSSRPTTPSASIPASASAAPENGSSRAPPRIPSRQSSKIEQGSDLEIKPLQKFESEARAPDVIPVAANPVRNSLILPDEEEVLHPSSKSSSKAVTPEPKPNAIKPERATLVHNRVPPVSEAESREVSRPSSKAETKPLQKRQPSPAPSPKPAPEREANAVPKPVEAKPIVAKPAVKVEPKAEVRQRALVSRPISAESVDLEVRQQTETTDGTNGKEC